MNSLRAKFFTIILALCAVPSLTLYSFDQVPHKQTIGTHKRNTEARKLSIKQRSATKQRSAKRSSRRIYRRSEGPGFYFGINIPAPPVCRDGYCYYYNQPPGDPFFYPPYAYRDPYYSRHYRRSPYSLNPYYQQRHQFQQKGLGQQNKRSR